MRAFMPEDCLKQVDQKRLFILPAQNWVSNATSKGASNECLDPDRVDRAVAGFAEDPQIRHPSSADQGADARDRGPPDCWRASGDGLRSVRPLY
ncbi:hypothetical protein MPLB_1990002 [Mesorhizobium sp. ORS 3324]|nr:hypothetical protein MPLB_1990002 [Mesorhizobium sp. ORS 3324]